MNRNQPTYANPLFLAAVLLAICLRFLNLGQAPLSETEAGWALQALEAAKPLGFASQVVIGPQPAYVFLTALLFRLFGVTNFMARFLPALAGVALVFVPFLMRERITRRAAIIAAFGLALDPGLTAVARQAGGPMLALGFGLAALALWLNRRPLLAGILAGVALLSGLAVFTGLISLSLGGLIAWGIWERGRSSPVAAAPAAEAEPGRSPWRKALLAGALTILILGTGCLRYPQGMAAWIDSLTAYLSGWAVPSGTGAMKIIAALLIYQPIALLFAILGIIRWAIKKFPAEAAPHYLALSWFGVSLVLTLAYPARQVSDLVWTLTPLWLMAAWELKNYLPARLPRQPEDLPAWLHAGLILLLSGLFFYTLISTRGIPAEGVVSPQITRLVLLLGILSLGALTSILVALGWSRDASRLGTAWGLLAAGSVYLAAALWGAAILRPNNPLELWGNPPGSGQVDLMSNTLDTLSKWNAGLANNLEVVSLVDTPALRWTLRDYPQARFVTALAESEHPAIIITPVDQANPNWAAAYRGQDFVWWAWPGWEGTLPNSLVDWIAFRAAPLQYEKIILWARSDLFPGGSLITEQSGVNPP